MSRRQSNEHDQEDHEQTDVQHASHELNPRDQRERVHVHECLDNQHRKDNQGQVPWLRLIVRVIGTGKALNHGGSGIGDTGQR